MHKLVVLYGQPTDPEHFRRYYVETHLPLAAKLPGLKASRYSFDVVGLGAEGPSPYFCIYEGEFADAAAMAAAMDSEIGKQVGADTANYATGGLTIVNYAAESAGPGRPAIPATAEEAFEAGMEVRRDMFGAPGADDQIAAATDFTMPMQDMVTRYCFGEVWQRPQIDRKTRSMMTMAMLVALARPNELRTHVRGAIANGATVEEIREVLLHTMIYAGVPAAVDSFRNANEVLKEMGLA
ncbi:MAG: EthD family reductase [Sneathiellaceae bacterium]